MRPILVAVSVAFCTVTSSQSFGDTFFWEDKKGVHATQNPSELPPKFLKKYKDLVKNSPAVEAPKPFPESAKSAVRALKKMEALCNSRLTVGDYDKALGETAFEVNMFVDSPDADDFPELKTSITSAMKLYKQASQFFEINKIQLQIARYTGDSVARLEEQRKNEEQASRAISDASIEVTSAFNLLNSRK